MPWRGESDPYRIWISEVVLQQTQVATVIDYYNRWLAAFPTVSALAAAPIDAVLRQWQGLGYYSRARNLHTAAMRINAMNGFPATSTELNALPGVGDYIAAAVASIAFGERIGVVDGNTIRVISRLDAIDMPSNSAAFRSIVRRRIESCFGRRHPGWVNQAWMEFGALQCKPAPDCSVCPLTADCAAHREGNATRYPVKPKKGKTPVRTGSIFIIRRGQKLLFVRRPESGLLGGLWELPNVLYDETPEPDFLAEFGLTATGAPYATVSHAYSHFKVEYDVKDAVLAGRWKRQFWTDSRWASVSQIGALALPKATRLALDAVLTAMEDEQCAGKK